MCIPSLAWGFPHPHPGSCPLSTFSPPRRKHISLIIRGKVCVWGEMIREANQAVASRDGLHQSPLMPQLSPNPSLLHSEA